jgi:hypothetical protein
MALIHALNAIDLFFRALMKIDNHFGGKIMVLGGDFRQATQVVSHATERVICFSWSAICCFLKGSKFSDIKVKVFQTNTQVKFFEGDDRINKRNIIFRRLLNKKFNFHLYLLLKFFI